VLLREARRLLQDTEHAVALARQAARAEAGLLTIAIVPGPEGQLFSRVMPLLLHNYPNLEVVLRSMTSPEQIVALQKGEINVGLLRGPIDDERIGYEVVSREDVVAVLPADHPLAESERVSPKALAELPLIQLSHTVAPAVHDAMIRTGLAADVQFKTLITTENIMTTLNAVASGMGFTLLAAYVEDILPKNAVVRALDMKCVPQLDLLVAYRKDDQLPALAFFLRILRAGLEQRPASRRASSARMNRV
jgi:LysR family hca operon transcriptional activator